MANAYKNVFVTNIDNIPTSGDTTNLGEFQIGVYNADTYSAVSTPSLPTVKKIFIAQGTSDEAYPAGIAISNETRKTTPFSPQQIKGWTAKKAEKPQNMIVRLGFDGVDTTKDLSWKVGKDLRVFIALQGQPIANILGATNEDHSAQYIVELNPVLPCAEECVDTCGDTYDCNVVADAILEAALKHKPIGNIPLVSVDGKSGWLKVSKVLECDSVPTPSGSVECQKFQLTIPDNGDGVALGVVQAQYPTYNIERVDREGVYSTYELVDCDGNTPDAFTSSTIVIPNCTTCPSGSTTVDSAYVYTATKSGIQASTAANGATGYVIGSGVILGTAGAYGQTVIQFYSTSGDLATVAASIPTFVVAYVGTVQELCQVPGTETSWVEGDPCKKAVKNWVISLKLPNCSDGDCGGDLLTSLQAAYAGIGTVTELAENTDTCTCKYQIAIESDNYCQDCNSESFTWSVIPQPYNGTAWVEVEGTNGTGCTCGIQFESAYVSLKRKECFFDAISYELEPLFINVSTRNPDLNDFSQLCESEIPVTVIQGVKYASGKGSFIADFFKRSRFDYNDPWKPDAAERYARGYELGVDLDGFYDQYVITFGEDYPGKDDFSGLGQSRVALHELSVYFPAGQGQSFVNAINSFVTYPGSTVSPISL